MKDRRGDGRGQGGAPLLHSGAVSGRSTLSAALLGGTVVKKIFKLLGIALLVIVLAAAGAALYIQARGIPHYAVQTIDLKVESTPERVERGRKIASMLCAACHLDPTTGRLTGKRMADMPPQFGEAFSLNITRHPEKGIGRWTDGE